jgi:amino acid transporter
MTAAGDGQRPSSADDPVTGHSLKKTLRLGDLVQMQILLVVGVTWIGIAARQGGQHVLFWVAAILTLFVPSAIVVTWCVRIWPQEGGVYQWTRHVFGPFAGFLSAWNFGTWALLTVANLGLITSTSLAYGLGPRFRWMAESDSLTTGLNIGLFAVILLICIPGFGIGKYVSHLGTGVMIVVNLLLVALLFVHPHTSPAHPHVSPQSPFSFVPTAAMFTILSVNLFSKMAFNALTGLEQIAVFAGEIRDPARSILRSAWIAAPIIALIFILGTGSILTYVPAAKVDLVGPVPQVLAAAFAAGSTGAGMDWGLMLGRAAILGLALTVVAQYALIVAETSRLPMVAGWDGLVPAWFTRLSPRFRTPVRSIVTIVVLALAAAMLASSHGTGAQEAYQLLTNAANLLYAVYFGMMFAIPLFAGARLRLTPAEQPGPVVILASLSGLTVTVLASFFNAFPIVDVPNKFHFGLEVLSAGLAVNVVGAAIYWRGRRKGPASEAAGSLRAGTLP